jgi:hypothetical protein
MRIFMKFRQTHAVTAAAAKATISVAAAYRISGVRFGKHSAYPVGHVLPQVGEELGRAAHI